MGFGITLHEVSRSFTFMSTLIFIFCCLFSSLYRKREKRPFLRPSYYLSIYHKAPIFYFVINMYCTDLHPKSLDELMPNPLAIKNNQ